MVSKQSTDLILDLLYDELSPEESLRAQNLIAQNDDLKAEFQRLQATRNAVRAELSTSAPTQEVPQSVHDSIMAAAAAHLQSTNLQSTNLQSTNMQSAAASHSASSEKNTSETKAAPTQAFEPRPKTTFWTRIASTHRSQFTAIATVAALLLATAVLLRQTTNHADSPASFAEASHEVSESIAFAPKDTLSPPEKPMELAAAPAPKAQANEPHEFETASPASNADNEEKSKDAPLGGLFDKEDSATERSRSASRPSAEGRAPARREAQPRPAPARAKKMASKSYVDDSFAEDVFAAESPASSSAPRSPAGPEVNDRLEIYDSASGSGRAAGGSPTPITKSAAKPAPATRPMPAEKSAKTEKGEGSGAINPNQTLQDAETALTNRNFAAALTNADGVLNNAQAGPTARARALHIKALAYAQQNNLQRATETYDALQKQYPTYRTAEITRQRNALSPKPVQVDPVAPSRTY